MAVDDKQYRHRIFQKDGTVLGEWLDVVDFPDIKKEVNKLLATTSVKLARNDEAREVLVEALLLENDEELTTEDDHTLLADVAATSSIGPGSNADINLEYLLTAYWGGLENLWTESGENITTEDDEDIVIQVGAPEGRDIFSGYIEEWETGYGEDEESTLSLVSHSDELNNIMFATPDTIKLDNKGYETSVADPPYAYGQSFTAPSTFDLGKVTLPVGALGNFGGPVLVQVDVYTGGTVGSGTLLGTAQAYVDTNYTSNPSDPILWAYTDFIFATAIPLTNGTQYHFRTSRIGTGSYKIAGKATGTYSGGSLAVNDGSGWAAQSSDMDFQLYTLGGVTTVTITSTDPAYMVKQILDFARSRGSRVNYTPASIEATGTLATYTFKTMTCREAIEKALELCPADTYLHYDFGQNIVHLHPLATSPLHTLTRGKDIRNLKIRRTMREMVNEVYFSGAGNPSLYDKTVDTGSHTSYRPKIAKMSDNRVANLTDSSILSQAEINRKKNPLYTGSGDIVDSVDDYIEDFEAGDRIAFQGFGNWMDSLVLVLAQATYEQDELGVTLGAVLPPQSQRVEDLKKELDLQQQVNNPNSPS